MQKKVKPYIQQEGNTRKGTFLKTHDFVVLWGFFFLLIMLCMYLITNINNLHKKMNSSKVYKIKLMGVTD